MLGLSLSGRITLCILASHACGARGVDVFGPLRPVSLSGSVTEAVSQWQCSENAYPAHNVAGLACTENPLMIWRFAPVRADTLIIGSIRDNRHRETRLDLVHDGARAEAQDIVFGKEIATGESFEICHVAG